MIKKERRTESFSPLRHNRWPRTAYVVLLGVCASVCLFSATVTKQSFVSDRCQRDGRTIVVSDRWCRWCCWCWCCCLYGCIAQQRLQKCQHLKQRCTTQCKGHTSDKLGGGGIGGGDGKPEAEEEAWPLWPGVRRLREAIEEACGGMVFNGMHWGNGSMKQWECLLFKTSASVRWTHCCDVKTVVLWQPQQEQRGKRRKRKRLWLWLSPRSSSDQVKMWSEVWSKECMLSFWWTVAVWLRCSQLHSCWLTPKIAQHALKTYTHSWRHFDVREREQERKRNTKANSRSAENR